MRYTIEIMTNSHDFLTVGHSNDFASALVVAGDKLREAKDALTCTVWDGGKSIAWQEAKHRV